MVPGIRINGLDFSRADTGLWLPKVGVSDFALFKRWMMPSGVNALVEPRLQEWHQLALEGNYHGPITLRVFRYAHPNNQFGFQPATVPLETYKRALREFTEYVSDRDYREFYVEWTAGDAQYLFNPDTTQHHRFGDTDPSRFGQQTNEECQALVNLPVWFEELNQRWQNGRAYGNVSPKWGDIHPLVRSSGYFEETKWGLELVRDYVNYHPNRTHDHPRWPKYVYDIPASITALHTYYNLPVDLNEPMRYDEDTDPATAKLMGSFIGWCAGVLFHSQRGRDGDGFHGTLQRQAAVNFFRGAGSGVTLRS